MDINKQFKKRKQMSLRNVKLISNQKQNRKMGNGYK